MGDFRQHSQRETNQVVRETPAVSALAAECYQQTPLFPLFSPVQIF
jgi:hypothetical protein